MNNNAKRGGNSWEFYDFTNDFAILTNGEKRNVLKIARTYWKLQKENEAPFVYVENDSLFKEVSK